MFILTINDQSRPVLFFGPPLPIGRRMLSSWLEPLAVSTAKGLNLRHVVLGGPSSAGNDRDRYKLVPVRGVVAQRPIARGETLAVIPLMSCLQGQTAADVVVGRCPNLLDATSSVVRSASSSVTLPFSTRGPVLVTVALAVMRLASTRGSNAFTNRFSPWVAAMPKNLPPIGGLVRHHVEKSARPAHEVSRRLRLGNKSMPYDGSSSAADSVKLQSMDLMLQHPQHALAEFEQPRVEVAVTQSMVSAFQSGDMIALSEGHQAMHRSERAADGSAFRHISQIERELVVNILEPLVPAVLEALASRGIGSFGGPGQNAPSQDVELIDDDEKLAGASASAAALSGREVLDALKWAHFCVRSRSVNINHHERSLDDGVALPAIVPLLDMLNHCSLMPNVTFRTVPGTSSALSKVVLVAHRPIEAGCELVTNYSDFWRRLVLYDVAKAKALMPTRQQKIEAEMLEMGTEVRREQIALHSASTAPDGVTGETLRRSSIETDETLRITESSKQLVPSGPATRIIPAEIADAARSGDRQGQIGIRKQAVSDAEWAWMFGFVRDEEEIQRAIAVKWERGLFVQAAKLTAPHSKAEKGAFVIGVPLGLESLHAQRAAIIRDKYKGNQVFPPQRNT